MLKELFRSADILSLVIDNYVLFIMVIGTFLVTGFDKLLDKRIVRLSRLALTLLLLLVLGENMKAWNDVAPRDRFLLYLFSALCYCVRISIMLVLIWIIQKKVSKWVVLPAVFNAIVAFSAVFTDRAAEGG